MGAVNQLVASSQLAVASQLAESLSQLAVASLPAVVILADHEAAVCSAASTCEVSWPSAAWDLAASQLAVASQLAESSLPADVASSH